MFLVLSSSLHPSSRSRILAREAADRIARAGQTAELFDLAENPLPACDGDSAYADETVKTLAALIEQAEAILVASPVYNYDVNAAAKNAVELTGRMWTGKIVGMLLAAGARSSYMSSMGLAGSLMLDFRCLIVPRFVYATGDCFEGDRLADEDIERRIDELVQDTVKLAHALAAIE
jgi:NAD(P)H-dependent FMN reductase